MRSAQTPPVAEVVEVDETWQLPAPEEIVVSGRAAPITVYSANFSHGVFKPDASSRRQHPTLPPSVRFAYQGSDFPEGAVRVRGEWPKAWRETVQLHVLSVEDLHVEVEWICRLLAELPGVGERTVERLRERYGSELSDTLDAPNVVGRLVQETGISPRRAQRLVERWRQLSSWDREYQRGLREAKVNAPLRARIARHLQEHAAWGHGAAVPLNLEGETISIPADPFAWPRRQPAKPGESEERLIHRFTPRLADALAGAWGVPAQAPGRVRANLVLELEERESQGDTCYPRDRLERMVRERLKLPGPAIREHLNRALADGDLLMVRPPTTPTPQLYLPHLYQAETSFAAGILSRLEDVDELVAEPPARLIPEQAAAFRAAFQHSVSVLTGSPGRGKTETVVEIMGAYERAGLPVLPMATTARAAVIMRDRARAAGLELVSDPGTIHRSLRLHGRLPELPEGPGLAVFEEASMLDIEVAGQALARLPDDFRVLFVGDFDQLPSVGPGNVFGDLIESGLVPVSRLVHNFRTENSDLALAIDAIREGRLPEKSPNFERSEFQPGIFGHPENMPILIPKAVRFLATKYQIEPLDVLVLAPRRKGGPQWTTSAENLNPVLRTAFNPGAAGLRPSDFAVGDKVVHVRNDYRLGRANGEQGRVLQVENGRRSRTVLVGYADGSTTYEDDSIDALLRLNFSGTVHRNQGGEAPAVLVLLRQSDSPLLTRRLVYTAVSRARRGVLVLEEPDCLAKAVSNRRERGRHGLLRERLRGEI